MADKKPVIMQLQIGKTYIITATPNEGYICKSISLNTGDLEMKPDKSTGIGTATFKMNDKVTSIDATFVVKEGPKQDVTVGEDSDEKGNPISGDNNGIITVDEQKNE